MSNYLCNEAPDLLDFETEIVESRPGAVLLARSALHPGGGGQESDQAWLDHAGGCVHVVGARQEQGAWWHLLDAPLELRPDAVVLRVDIALT